MLSRSEPKDRDELEDWKEDDLEDDLEVLRASGERESCMTTVWSMVRSHSIIVTLEACGLRGTCTW